MDEHGLLRALGHPVEEEDWKELKPSPRTNEVPSG
jgi:hypothetical protein